MPEPQQPDARSAPLLDPENAVRCDTEGEAASGPSPQASEAPPPATKGSGSAALVFVLWNTMMGSTLLVMPSCFRESGWLLGLVLACCLFEDSGALAQTVEASEHDPHDEGVWVGKHAGTRRAGTVVDLLPGPPARTAAPDDSDGMGL